jgi:hypothetical protein
MVRVGLILLFLDIFVFKQSSRMDLTQKIRTFLFIFLKPERFLLSKIIFLKNPGHSLKQGKLENFVRDSFLKDKTIQENPGHLRTLY